MDTETVIKELLQDPEFLERARDIAKFDTYVDDHDKSTRNLTYFLIVHLRKNGVSWMSPWDYPTQYHSAWPLRLFNQEDGKIHMTRWASDVHLNREQCDELQQTKFLQMESGETCCLLLSLAEFRDLFGAKQEEELREQITNKRLASAHETLSKLMEAVATHIEEDAKFVAAHPDQAVPAFGESLSDDVKSFIFANRETGTSKPHSLSEDAPGSNHGDTNDVSRGALTPASKQLKRMKTG